MEQDEFDKICDLAVEKVRFYTPIATGNLRYNAVQFAHYSPTVFKIGVDESIAPYMPYTNEPWVSPKWRGKKNPNEHWFQDTARDVAQIIAETVGGTLREI